MQTATTRESRVPIFEGLSRQLRTPRGRISMWVVAAGFIAAPGLWSSLTFYEAAVRFIVAAGTMVLMFQAFHVRRYAVAAVFGVLALLYLSNPAASLLRSSWGHGLAEGTR